MSGMRRSTIKMVLRNKIEDFLKSIVDKKTENILAKNIIVSGGAIASMLAGEKVNDYDVYFKTREAALVAANYYVDLFNSTNGQLSTRGMRGCNPEIKEEKRTNVKGESEDRIIIFIQSSGVAGENQEEYGYFESETETNADKFVNSFSLDDTPLENPFEASDDIKKIIKDKENKYRPVFFSENAITLSNKIQLVIRFYGSPQEIHDNYDYAHAMCYYDYLNNELVIHSEALESILSKTLIYKGSLYPVASVFRVRKFIARGWRISAGQLLKILMQISKIDLSDKKILREQLIGVDQAYMSQLMRALESETSNRVDETYLVKIIDEIFEGN